MHKVTLGNGLKVTINVPLSTLVLSQAALRSAASTDAKKHEAPLLSKTSGPVQGLAESTKEVKRKTVRELDEELREKLEARSGGGGEAGLELEGGKPVTMKRSVKENMFRLI